MTLNVRAILFDIGDTLLVEAREVKDSTGVTLQADLWPGMADAARQLKARGYPIGIVADAYARSAQNVLRQHHLEGVFDVLALSETVGTWKPDPRIFRHALDALGIEQPDYGRVLHVGNRLERDVTGANGLGLTSVWIRWNDRARTWVQAPWEQPDYTVHSVAELLALIEGLETGEVDPIQSPTPAFPRERGREERRLDEGHLLAKWGSEPPTSRLPPLAWAAGLDLAARYAPVIRLDRHEPFRPLAVGYTVFRQDGYSPSFPRYVGLTPVGRQPATLAIEYAIWWDWDIQHLYELEHTWTFVGADGNVAWAEGSWHGDFWELRFQDQTPLIDDTHPLAYCQPGKHAFTGTPEYLLMMRDYTLAACGPKAGSIGFLVTPIFAQVMRRSQWADELARQFLKTQAFVPTHQFDQEFRITSDLLVPWTVLQRWIPARMSWWLGQLRDA
jgi:HAD superfamily hydrolase (TIGR01549 family)